MTRKIAIATQKGGVGKTTTALFLNYELNRRGYKTLLIDFDPQRNASDTYRAKIENHATLYDVLCAEEPIINAIQETEAGDIVASDPLLADAENKLTQIGREYILKEALEKIDDKYDFMIFDTPPNLGILTTTALTAADEVIIPVTADRYSIQGVADLRKTIAGVKKYSNPNLLIKGLLLVMFVENEKLSKEVIADLPMIAEQLGTNLFNSFIRRCVETKKSQAERKHLYDYAPKCTTSVDYITFVDELINGGVKNG